MNELNIVPNKTINDLTSDELGQLNKEIITITAEYEEANSILEQLVDNFSSLAKAGQRFNELTCIVRRKINDTVSSGIIGKIA